MDSPGSVIVRILRDAHRDHDQPLSLRPGTPRRHLQGPQRRAEACLAGRDCPAQCRRGWHQRDHAADRDVEDVRMAMAGAFHARRRGRPAPRQDPAFADSAAGAADQAPGAATPVSGTLDLGEAPAAPVGATILPWPKSLPDQVSAVAQLLAGAGAPMSSREVARAFAAKRPATVTPVLDALAAIGQARRLADGRYAA